MIMILGRPKIDVDPNSLSGWLHLATTGLAAQPQARIRSEIEAHYVEAVGFYLAGDASESTAQAAALAGLGDPKVAAKRFRKSHLTAWEEEWLKSWEKPFLSRDYWWLLLVCGPIAAHLVRSPRGWPSDVYVLLGVFIMVGPRLLLKRLPARSRFNWLSFFFLAAGGFFGLGFLYLFRSL